MQQPNFGSTKLLWIDLRYATHEDYKCSLSCMFAGRTVCYAHKLCQCLFENLQHCETPKMWNVAHSCLGAKLVPGGAPFNQLNKCKKNSYSKLPCRGKHKKTQTAKTNQSREADEMGERMREPLSFLHNRWREHQMNSFFLRESLGVHRVKEGCSNKKSFDKEELSKINKKKHISANFPWKLCNSPFREPNQNAKWKQNSQRSKTLQLM